MNNRIINTGIKFYGIKVLLESTGEPEIDRAARDVFKDSYWLAGVPAINWNVRLLLEWSQKDKDITEHLSGQLALWQG